MRGITHKFRLGDRVRVKTPYHRLMIGTIMEYGSTYIDGTKYYTVDFDKVKNQLIEEKHCNFLEEPNSLFKEIL